MEALKYGDRIRYIGHTANCKSCVKSSVKVIDPSGLDDQDEFVAVNDSWIPLIGEEGIIFTPGSETS